MDANNCEVFQDLSKISVHHFDIDSISSNMFTTSDPNNLKKENPVEDSGKLFSDNEDEEDIPNVSRTRRTIGEVVERLLSSNDQLEVCDGTAKNKLQKNEIVLSSEENSTANMESSKSLSSDASVEKSEPSLPVGTNKKADYINYEFDITEFHTAEDLHNSLKTSTVVNTPTKELPSPPAVSPLTERRSHWVQCDRAECQKWRRVDHPDDLATVADGKWLCCMNEDEKHNNCDDTQETIPSESEDESVYTTHTPGSLVLGKMTGYPWWPAIIEDDPDFDSYFYLEKKKEKTLVSYHLTFLGKDVSRAWLPEIAVTNFTGDESLKDLGTLSYRGKHFGRAVTVALREAKNAKELSLKKRVRRYGFLRRYKGEDKTQRRSQVGEVSPCSTKKGSPQAESRNVIQNVTAPMRSKEIGKKVKPMGKLTARKFKENVQVPGKGDIKCKPKKIRKKKSFKISCKPLRRGADSSTSSSASSEKTQSSHSIADTDECEKTANDVALEEQSCQNEIKSGPNVLCSTVKSTAPAPEKGGYLTENLNEEVTPSQEHAENMIVKYTDKELLERVLVNANEKKKLIPNAKQKSRSEKNMKASNSNEIKKKPTFTKKKTPKDSAKEKDREISKMKSENHQKDVGENGESAVLKDQLSSCLKIQKTEAGGGLATENGGKDREAPAGETNDSSLQKSKKIKKSNNELKKIKKSELSEKKSNKTTTDKEKKHKRKDKKRNSSDEIEAKEKECVSKHAGCNNTVNSQLSKTVNSSEITEITTENVQMSLEKCEANEIVHHLSEDVTNEGCHSDGVKPENVPKLVKPALPAVTADEIIKMKSTNKTLPKLKKSFKAPIKNPAASQSKPIEIPAKRSVSKMDDCSSVEPPKKKALIEDDEFADFEFNSQPTHEPKNTTGQVNVPLSNSPEF